MKKQLAMLLVAAMTVTALGGCGSDKGSGASNSSTAQTQGTDEAATSSVEGTDQGSSQGIAALKDMDVDSLVTLGEYKGLAVTVAPASVDDSQWDQLVKQVYEGSVTKENGGIIDRAVANGDTVNIDYEGKKDGVAFDGGTAQGQLLTIGSGQFIDGFEEGLIGVTPGETVDLDLTFPETYQNNPDLAGAAVVFTVTVNYIVPTELEDTVVAAFGEEEYKTVEELRQYVYDYLYSNAESSYNSNVENSVLNAFMTGCTFKEMPSDMLEQYSQNIKANLDSTAASMGADADTYTSYFYNMDAETFISTYAEESVKQSVALQAVANKEGLAVTDDELESLLSENATNAGFGSVEEFMGNNTREEYREYFMFEKTVKFLVDNAVISEQ